ncbi:MAG: VanZ family protein [Roseburia sp.]
MDIYQSWVSNNQPWSLRPWSLREVIVFLLVLLIAVIVLGFLYRKKKVRGSQVFAGLLMIVFLGVVFAITVFTRNTGTRKYELELFWSWREIIFHGNRQLLQENLLNLVLLLPAGILLPILCHKRLSWWKGLLFGLVISAGIEICQFVLCRGFLDLDDIIHNGVGCMVGCVICSMIGKKYLINFSSK